MRQARNMLRVKIAGISGNEIAPESTWCSRSLKRLTIANFGRQMAAIYKYDQDPEGSDKRD